MDYEKLLEALSDLIHSETESIKAEMQGIKDDVCKIKKDIVSLKDDTSGIKVLMDEDIRKRLNLLSEGQQTIIDRLPSEDDVAEADAVDARLSAVEAVIRKHSKDIQSLKKAQ